MHKDENISWYHLILVLCMKYYVLCIFIHYTFYKIHSTLIPQL